MPRHSSSNQIKETPKTSRPNINKDTKKKDTTKAVRFSRRTLGQDAERPLQDCISYIDNLFTRRGKKKDARPTISQPILIERRTRSEHTNRLQTPNLRFRSLSPYRIRGLNPQSRPHSPIRPQNTTRPSRKTLHSEHEESLRDCITHVDTLLQRARRNCRSASQPTPTRRHHRSECAGQPCDQFSTPSLTPRSSPQSRSLSP